MTGAFVCGAGVGDRVPQVPNMNWIVGQGAGTVG